MNKKIFCLVMQAGITTTLNSRCSVLAAANSVFGRWDETKGEEVRGCESCSPMRLFSFLFFFYRLLKNTSFLVVSRT